MILFGKQIKKTFESLLAVIFKEATIKQEMFNDVSLGTSATLLINFGAEPLTVEQEMISGIKCTNQCNFTD